MLAIWPGLASIVVGKVLTVTGTVQPTPITFIYQIRLVYPELGSPKVYIDHPALQRRSDACDAPIPHTYCFDTPGSERPCLYYPDGREWNPAKSIATTIMPWLLAWLVDYEVWHATGLWIGGGLAHFDDKRRGDGIKDADVDAA